MGRVVIHDDMNIHVFGNIGFDLGKEFLELLRAMPIVTFADYLAGCGIQSGEKGRCSVACIIMRAPLRRLNKFVQRHQRQDRHPAAKRLDL